MGDIDFSFKDLCSSLLTKTGYLMLAGVSFGGKTVSKDDAEPNIWWFLGRLFLLSMVCLLIVTFLIRQFFVRNL